MYTLTFWLTPVLPKWTAGRRGDLRDIWKAAVRGALKEDGTPSNQQGKIYTVLGRKAIESSLSQITQEINVIGHHFQDTKVKTVAISLTDSVELLAAIFAGAFYGFKTLRPMLSLQEAGSLDLSAATKGNKKLTQVLWVAKYGNRHMDWHEVPDELKGGMEVEVWHELVESKKDLAGLDIPEYDASQPTPGLSTVWPSETQSGKFIDFEPENIIAGISSLGSVLPRSQRFNPSDLVLSIDSLSRSYPLCQIMSALFSNASIALNSVAGEDVDFALATVGVSPTVIIASSRTMSKYHEKIMAPQAGLFSSLGRWVQSRSLDSGNMPSKGFFSQLAKIGPTAELSLDNLRLLCISHRIDDDSSVRLSSQQLNDLRIFTNARIVYALTGPGVAGAIAQTNVFDYRLLDGPSHFGSPLSSTEATLVDVPESKASDTPEGKLVVEGPAVVGEKTMIPVQVRFGLDNTLELRSSE
ncbi:hypothetical protein N7468_007958 [Penicillium chermesinum]|uniref:AMP-dependent synthetase/ligase domain-containing protein n=1 Tax=Penicillium chermesinum TaxID=63820 RepID=A0A9W9THX5_9EURO|nr:uncharacterized protein N7468_007958 [Penicillium chermesinum]KAJ5223416.1 hypothetical protein N7468_007958 [Penicillium chermesinum]